jgi:antitoxin Phd
METVRIREAKANFSALIAAAEGGRPTLITRHGQPAAMVVPVEAGERLFPLATPSFAKFLLGLPELLDTERDTAPLRDVDL